MPSGEPVAELLWKLTFKWYQVANCLCLLFAAAHVAYSWFIKVLGVFSLKTAACSSYK